MSLIRFISLADSYQRYITFDNTMNGTDMEQDNNSANEFSKTSKRNRTVSVSGRLRSVSILCSNGIISGEDKDSMKDLILTQDPLIEEAFLCFENGDDTKLKKIIDSGYLKKDTEFSFLDTLEYSLLEGLTLDTNVEHLTNSIFDESDMSDELDLDGIKDISSKRDLTSMEIQTLGDPSDYNRADPVSDYSYNHLEEEPIDYSIYQSTHPTPSYPDEYHIHLEPAGQELMTSSYIIDTSILTLSETNHMDEKRNPVAGLTPINTQIESQKKFIGIYSPESRKKRVQRFFEKRKQRVWTKKVKYDVRKNFADSRLRVKGRFVKKEDEELLRELMNLA